MKYVNVNSKSLKTTVVSKDILPDSLQKKINKTSVRKKMKEDHGYSAFLKPKELKFPVVDPDSGDYHCGLLYAAYVRAKQWNYNDVAKKAKKLYKDNNCKSSLGREIE